MNPQMEAEPVVKLEIPMRRNPLGKTFSYLLKESATLIDTGVPTREAMRALERQLQREGFKPGSLERVILTHLHVDHMGLAERLSALGVEIWASAQACERLEVLREESERFFDLLVEEAQAFGAQEYLAYVDSLRHLLPPTPPNLEVDQTIRDGQTINLPGATLKAIWTPGHAPEHLCLHWESQRILFSGDHVLPKITSHISLRPHQDQDPLADYLDSLGKVEGLDARIVHPGHQWSFENLAQRVKELRQHHRQRLEEIHRAIKGKERTVFQVASQVHWESRPWRQMDFWTKRMAAAETYAHLKHLENLGKAHSTLKNNTLRFTAL